MKEETAKCKIALLIEEHIKLKKNSTKKKSHNNLSMTATLISIHILLVHLSDISIDVSEETYEDINHMYGTSERFVNEIMRFFYVPKAPKESSKQSEFIPAFIHSNVRGGDVVIEEYLNEIGLEVREMRSSFVKHIKSVLAHKGPISANSIANIRKSGKSTEEKKAAEAVAKELERRFIEESKPKGKNWEIRSDFRRFRN